MQQNSIQFPRLFYLLVCCVLICACSPRVTDDVHLSGATMGTTYNVKYSGLQDKTAQQLQTEIDALLVHINKLMSTYDPQSELSRFNQWCSTDPFLLSEETLMVMREAKRLGKLSQGVLDVTVGPLVNLWGFGPSARPEKIPSTQRIEEVKASTGLDKLLLLPGAARKTQANLYVDLSTIAKGYGVDQVADLLESNGLHNYLVEIGGEMRVSGHKASGQNWRIAVEKPLSTERAVQQVISIGNNAIATSGDYRNYFEQDGVRYSHLIDPLTGYPIQHNLVSVTVTHASSMTADGLATALIVMGKDKALALATENHWPVLLITRENNQFITYTTPEFDPYLTSD
jgi:thiamine biosynthesis lipoprotein